MPSAYRANAYRETVAMQLKYLERIKFLVALGANDLSDDTLRALALQIPQLNVFEACASGDITAEQALTIFKLRREAFLRARPWFVRVVAWIGWFFWGQDEKF